MTCIHIPGRDKIFFREILLTTLMNTSTESYKISITNYR